MDLHLRLVGIAEITEAIAVDQRSIVSERVLNFLIKSQASIPAAVDRIRTFHSLLVREMLLGVSQMTTDTRMITDTRLE
jgi:hypothetical protein